MSATKLKGRKRSSDELYYELAGLEYSLTVREIPDKGKDAARQLIPDLLHNMPLIARDKCLKEKMKDSSILARKCLAAIKKLGEAMEVILKPGFTFLGPEAERALKSADEAIKCLLEAW